MHCMACGEEFESRGSLYCDQCASYSDYSDDYFDRLRERHEVHFSPKCECGALKTKQPGHSWYCPLFKDKK